MSKFERMNHRDWSWLPKAKSLLLAESMTSVANQVLKKLPTHAFLLETDLKNWLKWSWRIIKSDYRTRYDLNPNSLLTLLAARIAYMLSGGSRRLQYQLMFPSLDSLYDVLETNVYDLPIGAFILIGSVENSFLDIEAAFSVALQDNPGERGIRNLSPTSRGQGYQPYLLPRDVEKLRVHLLASHVLDKIERLEEVEQQAQGPHIAALIKLRQGLERGDQYNEGNSDSAGEPASVAILEFADYLELLSPEEKKDFLAWPCKSFAFYRGLTKIDVNTLSLFWDLLRLPADYSQDKTTLGYATCVNERWRKTVCDIIERARGAADVGGLDESTGPLNLMKQAELALEVFDENSFSVSPEEEFLPAIIAAMKSETVGQRVNRLSPILSLLPQDGILLNIAESILWQAAFDEAAFIARVRDSQRMRVVPQDAFIGSQKFANGESSARDFNLLDQQESRFTYEEFSAHMQRGCKILLGNVYVLSLIKSIMYAAMQQVLYLLGKRRAGSLKEKILKALRDRFVDDALDLFAVDCISPAWKQFIHVARHHQSSFNNHREASSVVYFFKKVSARSFLLRWMFATGKLQIWGDVSGSCFRYANFQLLCKSYGVEPGNGEANVVIDVNRPLWGEDEVTANAQVSLLPASLLMKGLSFSKSEALAIRPGAEIV